MTDLNVFVLAGPTAVGKGTVVTELRHRFPQLVVSISVTTRAPRPLEEDGVDYFFISDDEFQELIAENGLLEWAVVHGQHKYGTPREWVLQQSQSGRTVLLEIDLDGARQVRQTLPEATLIFLMPPSWEELERRLLGRGTEGPDERQRRLETARVEMEAAPEFDHVVINDDLDSAVGDLAALLGLV